MRKNKRGNLRGMPAGSRAGLERGRAKQRAKGGPPRNAGGNFAPAKRGGLGGNGLRKLHVRIRRFVKAAEADPSILGRSWLGSMLADLEEENTYKARAWAIVQRRLAAADDSENDPNGIECAKALLELAPVVETLQRMKRQTADHAVRISELQARLRDGGKSYLEERYGDSPKREPEIPEAPDDGEDLGEGEDLG